MSAKKTNHAETYGTAHVGAPNPGACQAQYKLTFFLPFLLDCLGKGLGRAGLTAEIHIHRSRSGRSGSLLAWSPSGFLSLGPGPGWLWLPPEDGTNDHHTQNNKHKPPDRQVDQLRIHQVQESANTHATQNAPPESDLGRDYAVECIE